MLAVVRLLSIKAALLRMVDVGEFRVYFERHFPLVGSDLDFTT